MPTINGQFTVTWTANETANTVDYVISGAVSDSGTESINCTGIPGPCSVTIPVTYDTPACDSIVIDVSIYSDCDPENAITFTQSFPLDQGCGTYKLQCIAPRGCGNFDTTSLCPTCEEYPSLSHAVIDSYSTNPQFDPPDVQQVTTNGYLPGQTAYRFCYSDLTAIQQELDPASWTISPDPDKCCWECRTYQFIFNVKELNGVNQGIRLFPDIYPAIIGTSCDNELGCYVPIQINLFPFGANYNPFVSQVRTACLRKDSYTIIGNYFPVTVNDLGPCSI